MGGVGGWWCLTPLELQLTPSTGTCKGSPRELARALSAHPAAASPVVPVSQMGKLRLRGQPACPAAGIMPPRGVVVRRLPAVHSLICTPPCTALTQAHVEPRPRRQAGWTGGYRHSQAGVGGWGSQRRAEGPAWWGWLQGGDAAKSRKGVFAKRREGNSGSRAQQVRGLGGVEGGPGSALVRAGAPQAEACAPGLVKAPCSFGRALGVTERSSGRGTCP